MSVLAVHGIGNHQGAMPTSQAAEHLATLWRPALATGYLRAGLAHEPLPELNAAYYADLLTRKDAQGSDSVDVLDVDDLAVMRPWLAELGSPEPAEAQGLATLPIRQALSWVARRNGVSARTLGKIGARLAREVRRYLGDPTARGAVREAVASAIRIHQPTVVVAHSLGSVVAYETLCAYPELKVERLVTLGSPLGLPGGIFERLDPGPKAGIGQRPPGVQSWVNLADKGDLVAVPKQLGDRFPVDHHDECSIHPLDFHTLVSYLSCGLTATAIAPFVRPAASNS